IMFLNGYPYWAVTYPSSNICALSGSTVEIRCNYKYPYYTVEKEFWFTNIDNGPVDLKDDTNYTGRVEYHCGDPSCNWFYSSCTGTCTLRIKDLRQSDAAEYKFRITTNKGGKYSGVPGVKLSVTETPSVGVTPPGVIEEGSSVNLTCTSEANPVAKYTWTKVTTDHSLGHSVQGQQLSFHPIQSSDSGQYLCTAKNDLGTKSSPISIDVKYGPKNTSVIPSPPGEIMEGGSVTLSCSSDANPAADYTWFKDNQPLPWEPRRPYTLDPVSSKDRGTYRCHAENQYGYLGSNSVFIDVQCEWKTIVTKNLKLNSNNTNLYRLICNLICFIQYCKNAWLLFTYYILDRKLFLTKTPLLLPLPTSPFRYETFMTICRYNAQEISFKGEPSQKWNQSNSINSFS
uniref:B-cell receptor CD22 n=1 Tax=Gadus morhua TaxID=8049 RepID=A0A8C4ZZY6_GADMO